MKKTMIASLAAVAVMLAVANQAHAGATLDAVKKKGFVQCGISDGLPGFSYADASGKFSGIDVDVCRGVAAAVFDDDTKVKYTPLTAKERFTALQYGPRLLDWEYCGDGDIALELASVWTDDDAQRQLLLNEYAQVARLSPRQLQRQMRRWRPWVLMLMAGWYELRWQQSQDKQFITLADTIWQQLQTKG
jgi:hypothetical protein